jgi:hypothetical protein
MLVQRCTMIGRAFRAGVIACSAIPVTINAQTGFPSVRWADSVPLTTVSIWPAQGVENLNNVASRGTQSVLARRADFPKDSINRTIDTRARAWLSWLERAPRTGLNQDGYAIVAARAHQDALADQQFAARLASPGLSLADRAYTYWLAVQAFAVPVDPRASERLLLAERYLKGLVALGTEGPAVTRQLSARLTLVQAYNEANRPADVARHGLAAIDLLPRVPFQARGTIFDINTLNALDEAIIDALIRSPGRLGKIAGMHAALAAAAVPPADSVAIDSAFYWRGRAYQSIVRDVVQLHATLGQQRGDIYSNSWINAADTGAHTVSVNDGKIRVIEIGSHFCGICLQGLDGLQRIHDAFPQIETIFLTSTVGDWGNRLISPEEESKRLADLYKNRRKITLPIALWRQQQGINDDGEGVPVGDRGELFNRYPQLGKPQYYILDGSGTIRRAYTTWSRDIEGRIVSAVRMLLNEQRGKEVGEPKQANALSSSRQWAPPVSQTVTHPSP